MSNDQLACIAMSAFCFSLITLCGLTVVIGKLFFSTHKREFLPIEEYAKLRRELGYSEPSPTEAAEQIADTVTKGVFGQPDEDYNELTTYRPHPALRVKPTNRVISPMSRQDDLDDEGEL